MNSKILIIFVLLAVPSFLSAYDFDVNGIYYNILSDDEVEVTRCDEESGCMYSGKIVIPASISWGDTFYRVSAIGGDAFNGCVELQSVSIPNTVKTIGFDAFLDCSGLESIFIPNSVTSIDGNPFVNCSKITSIIVEEGNPAYDSRNSCNALIETASNTMLAGCMNSTVPESITRIGSNAFAGCTGLKSVSFPAVKEIGDYAFDSCLGLISVDFGSALQSIGEDGFRNCENLVSLSIPQTLVNISGNAFGDCGSLSSITVEESNPVFDSRDNCNAIIETSSDKMILGCKNTIIPESVICIGYYAFGGSGLSSIVIPNSVETIENAAFWGCDLVSIEIPSSVTNIGNDAFSACIYLQNCKLPHSISAISEGMFRSCRSLSYVDIPGSVSTIGPWAFHYCTSLTSITIPSSVKSIGGWAFNRCSGLTEVISLANEPSKISANKNGVEGLWEKVVVEKIPLYVPKGAKRLYESAEGWKVFDNIIEMTDETAVNGLAGNSIGSKQAIYNIRGERMSAQGKGIVIINGKKFLR